MFKMIVKKNRMCLRSKSKKNKIKRINKFKSRYHLLNYQINKFSSNNYSKSKNSYLVRVVDN